MGSRPLRPPLNPLPYTPNGGNGGGGGGGVSGGSMAPLSLTKRSFTSSFVPTTLSSSPVTSVDSEGPPMMSPTENNISLISSSDSLQEMNEGEQPTLLSGKGLEGEQVDDLTTEKLGSSERGSEDTINNSANIETDPRFNILNFIELNLNLNKTTAITFFTNELLLANSENPLACQFWDLDQLIHFSKNKNRFYFYKNLFHLSESNFFLNGRSSYFDLFSIGKDLKNLSVTPVQKELIRQFLQDKTLQDFLPVEGESDE